MPTQSFAWNDLEIVLAVARGGSLSAAARALGVDHSTVFRRLKALEAKVGARLFERLPGGYAATAAGTEMRSAAERVESEIQDLERRLAGRDLRLEGRVRLTAPDDLMEGVLIEPLARFRRRFPGIRIEAVVDNRMLNLTRREADVAVRPTRDPPEALVGRRIAGIGMAVYASRARRDLLGAAGLADLAGREWIGWEEGGGPAAGAAWTARHLPDGQWVYRTNSMRQQLVACRAGLGLALLPRFLGDGDAALVRVLPLGSELASGLWLLTHRDLRRTARIRALLDFLYEELRPLRPLFEGRPEAFEA